jgi:uncharacterized protein
MIARWLREAFARRPWWMNGLMLFCVFMAFLYMPVDFLLKPVAGDEEVWLGVIFRGWAAKLTEPLHWLIYAAGVYGFWRMRPWMWPWAALYVGQIAIAMLVWNVVYVGGVGGWLAGLVSGAVFAGLARALWSARGLFARPRPSMRERYGDWALITGASAGLGEAYARALARDGVNCVLTARRENRLRALAGELERQHGVATRVVAADLADPAGADAVLDAVRDLEVAILVNNAGFGYAGRFDKQDVARLRSMVTVNCLAPVMLASTLIPAMRARGRGAMIMLGSIAGSQPLPLHALYSATKAFDNYLGEALWAELRGSGVDVLVVEPGATATEFATVAGENRELGEPAADVVALSLERLGQQPSVISGWFNWLRAQAGFRLLPRSLLTLVAQQVVTEQTPIEMR